MDLLYTYVVFKSTYNLYCLSTYQSHVQKKWEVYVGVMYNIMRTIKIKPCNEGKDVSTKSSVCAVNCKQNKRNMRGSVYHQQRWRLVCERRPRRI